MRPRTAFVEHRGGSRPPRRTLTVEDASRLEGLVGMNHMTLRRALAPVRAGRWLPAGGRHWRVLYTATGVRKIAKALASGRPNPCLVRESRVRRARPMSSLPHGTRSGWATSDDIQIVLAEHGVDGTYFAPRWLRERLLALGIPSEQRVVRTRKQRVFPIDKAVAALVKDPLVKKRLGR